MKCTRIFIENLPETATESNIRKKFLNFGEVTSIEIKERKVKTYKSWSKLFAYVNLKSDDQTLQKCFQFFNQTPWEGQTIKLQIAKESFLDKLKKERQLKITEKHPEKAELSSVEPCPKKLKPELNGTDICKNKDSFISSSSSEDDEILEANIEKEIVIDNIETKTLQSHNLIVKDNRNKRFKGKLEIESFGKEPVLKIGVPAKPQKNLDKFRSLADDKRVGSLLEKRKAYNQQKSAIQAALSYSNLNKSQKTIFDSEEIENKTELKNENHKVNNKKSLFDDNDSDSEEGSNRVFEIKEKFQGKSGEKLLKLQATFKNDKRFTLNENFLENQDQSNEKEEDDGDIENEKRKEFEILGEILGCEVKSKITSQTRQSRSEYEPKTMRRFDPSQPDHAKYELKKEDKTVTKKKKKDNLLDDKKVDSKDEPEVSKEVFYTVKDDLKKSLEPNSGFSLLNMFGSTQEKVDNTVEIPTQLIKKKKYTETDNPFKYDSSDDEDQTDQLIQKKDKPAKTVNSIKAWTEPFFFQEDDFRFQEGMDFVKRIATEEKEDFNQIRRNLKELTKNKVRNILRKNKPFRKKLGGNKKKKVRRINKALNR